MNMIFLCIMFIQKRNIDSLYIFKFAALRKKIIIYEDYDNFLQFHLLYQKTKEVCFEFLYFC